MMYISQRLLVSLVVLRSAEGRPSTSAAVELSTCGDVSAVSHSVVEECISTCQPILDAQNCSRNAACTCTIARPVAVQACLQCQLDASSSAVPNVLARIVPAKLYEYAQLCGEDITAQAVLRWDGGSEAASNATLQGREFLPSACLYGVPDIATSPLAILKSSRRAWPFVAVAVLMVLFVSERRFHK